jgi:SAM-dependent methyltransferase
VQPILDAAPMDVSGWDDALSAMPDGWRDKDYRLLSWVFRLRKLGGSLLDVGCAVGDGFPVLRKACPRVTELAGCDFSSEGVAVAAARFPEVSLFQHDLNDPLPRTWDNVICLQTVEHVEDPERAIANLDAAAKEVLIVATPYRNRRPDRDHRWSFDEHDFTDVFDGFVLDRRGLNIFWHRSPGRALARGSVGARSVETWERALRRLASTGRH